MKRPHLDLALEYLGKLDSPVVFDIGAHVGKITGFFLDACPSARIIAVEPDPVAADILVDRFEDRIEVLEVAVGSNDNVETLYRSDGGGNQGNSLDRFMLKEKKRAGRIRSYSKLMVRCVTPETLFGGYKKIDLLKMNCEGAERYVLSSPVLSRVGAIYMSQHQKPLIEPVGFKCIAKTWKGDHTWEFWKNLQ